MMRWGKEGVILRIRRKYTKKGEGWGRRGLDVVPTPGLKGERREGRDYCNYPRVVRIEDGNWGWILVLIAETGYHPFTAYVF